MTSARHADDAPLVAGLLIGGQSRRMGRPKHLLPADGFATIAECVVHAARTIADQVVLLGSAAELPAALQDLPQLPDERPNAGPAAGLAALLRHVQSDARKRGGAATHAGWALLLACDLPRLTPDALLRLWNSAQRGRSSHYDAVAFRPEKSARWEACCAMYHARVLPDVLRELDAGRSLQRILAAVRTCTLEPAGDDLLALTDVDSPADLGA